MIVPLAQAATRTCGAKAATLGAMRRAGLPVPDGFVVPFAVYLETVGDLLRRVADPGRLGPEIERRSLPAHVLDALEGALGVLGAPTVAVRSSAAHEDGSDASAAGQHDSFLAVQGVAGVADALRSCWASLHSSRAVDHRTRERPEVSGSVEPAMAVIVQPHLDVDVSGVMFTAAEAGGVTLLEAAWGLGPSAVGGTVTPDTYRVHADGRVTCSVADKRTRLDRDGRRLVTRPVSPAARRLATLDDTVATRLATLGAEAASALGGPQDIEWAVVDGHIWLLQARPVTAAAPAPTRTRPPSSDAATLVGTPGSHGSATGTARWVRGPSDFTHVRAGDVLVCPFTDPAWTPLLHLAAGVVTESGGALSHAAIVARERAIPAVLGVPDAIEAIPDGATVTIDGTVGTVTIRETPPEPRPGATP